jgi:hypothetical protein
MYAGLKKTLTRNLGEEEAKAKGTNAPTATGQSEITP